MKIRTDFVTNSSSSSFVVEVEVLLKDNTKIQLDEPMVLDPEDEEAAEAIAEYMECDPDENFNADLKKVLNCNNIQDLSDFLSKAIYVGESYDSEDEFFRDRQVNDFIDEINAIQDINMIKSITFKRNHMAWGEFAEGIVMNDDRLLELANTVSAEPSEENIEALKTYMTNANLPGPDYEFGDGVEKFIYKASVDDMEEIAEHILSGSAAEEGIEIYKADFENGEFESYAVLDI